MQGIKPSASEIETTNKLVEEISASMKDAIANGENLLLKLDQAFLCVDSNGVNTIKSDFDKIGSLIWKLKIAQVKMNDFQERIVKYAPSVQHEEWCEF